jgi:hypothetical protein
VTPFRRQSVWALSLALLSLCCPLWSQIIEFREYHGKKINCIHSGILTFGRFCGGEGYARVFTGTVLSATDISDFDKLLRLSPDESFVGVATGEVSAVVDQACMPANLPEMLAGDKWLFYLQPGESADAFIVPFDSPSKPIEQAQVEIGLLRRVARLTDLGMVTGQVTRIVPKGKTWDAVPVAKRSVIATRNSDGATFPTVSDESGHFQLELVPGSYHVTANVEPKSMFSEGDVLVVHGGCVEIGFRLDADKFVFRRESISDRILIPPPELPDHIPEQK